MFGLSLTSTVRRLRDDLSAANAETDTAKELLTRYKQLHREREQQMPPSAGYTRYAKSYAIMTRLCAAATERYEALEQEVATLKATIKALKDQQP